MYNQKKILLILLMFIFQINIYSVEDTGHDFRFEHAKLAFKEQKYQKALAILEQNITLGQFHLQTYLLLGDIYINLNQPAKALKAYYFIIKKAHDPEILDLVNLDHVASKLSQTPNPSREVMESYLKIGIVWYKLFTKMKYSPTYQKSLIRQAKKYFFICNWYQYQPMLTTYYLAVIERDQKNYDEAFKHFKQIKEISKDNPYSDPDEEGQIEFLIADTLQRAGDNNKASVYLRNLREDNSKSESLREHANSYLEAMHIETWSLSVSFMGLFDSNIHDLTAEERENFSENQDELVQKHAFMWRKELNFLYSSKRYNNYSYNFILQGREDLNFENKLAIYDQRELLFSTELDYDSFKQSLYKFRYQFLKTFTRQSYDEGLSGEKTKHTFTPKYSFNLSGKHNMGQITWSFPISLINNSITNQKTTELGPYFSYRSFEYSKYFSPVYSAGINMVGEEEGYDSSTQLILSFTNLFTNFEKTNILLTLEYLKNLNSSEELSFTTFSTDLTLSKEIKHIKNLYFDASLIRLISDESAPDTYSKWKIYAGLSYSI